MPTWTGCRQGAPESPALWKLLLDEAMGPLIRAWQHMEMGIYVPTLAMGHQGQLVTAPDESTIWHTPMTLFD